MRKHCLSYFYRNSLSPARFVLIIARVRVSDSTPCGLLPICRTTVKFVKSVKEQSSCCVQMKLVCLSARSVDQYVTDLDDRLHIGVVWNIGEDFFGVRSEGRLEGAHGFEE